ncbi:MAG: winged helix-turn-helix domain-containing protein, partial [Myxococcota bacterium]
MAAVVQLGQAEVDLTNRRVEGPAGRHHLTPLEASLLQFLIVRRGTTVSRDELLTEVWGYSRRVMTRAVDNTVSRLRRKVELDGDAPKWIVSTRGGGYRLEADPTQVAHQVPPERDAFVGRVDDLAALGRQLDGGARLVTILGPGGVGKTRVALRLAASRTAVHPGGVWFCDLSDARDAAGVVTAVARGLGVPVGPGDGVDAVRDLWVRRGRALVVLDNFEQVAAFAEPTLGAWLRGTTEAQVVVTSRARLGLDGEVVVALEPLPQADAEALFAVRAGALSGGAALPAEERPAVAALVALLDGLPLAIELAAARTGMLSPRGLLERMSDRFRVLTATGPRIDRHATLTATLDWSWHLLAEEERDALAQLSVFDGGFTPGAAEAVVELRGMWALDAVQALVDRSWVRRIAADRLDLLVSIRDYAAARLAERDGTRAAEERHGRHLAATVASEPARLALDGPTGAETFAALERERDNLAAAARRAIARGDGPVAAQTARAIWLVCARRGPVATAVALLEATPALPTRSERDRCLVSSPAGQARAAAGQPAIAIDHYRTGLALAEAQGLTSFAGQLHRSLGDLLHHLGDGPSARAHYAEALAAQRAVGNRRAEAFVLGNLGVTCIDAGDLVQAREHLAEALAVHREVGNRRAEGPVLGNLGLVAACEGRFDDARELLRESIATHRSFANLRGVATMTQNLAWVAVNQGQLAEADAFVSEA